MTITEKLKLMKAIKERNDKREAEWRKQKEGDNNA